ncbi:hypothetical protein CONPUDRAFT_26680, partial [Coniophora puteana RWD-64-598 SS2]
RLRAAAQVSRNVGRGPAYSRVLCSQARYFEANGMLCPSQQGRRKRETGLVHDEAFMLGLRRWMKTLKAGEITPLILQRRVNEHVLPSLKSSKTCVSESWARGVLIQLGYRSKSHKKGVYFDGHERKDVRQHRQQFLNEFNDVKQLRTTYDGVNMEPISPALQGDECEHAWLYQDEAPFHDNDFQNVSKWLGPGEQELKKKTRGRLMMVSGYICEKVGNLALTEDLIAENKKLPLSEQLVVTDSRVVIYPTNKESGDGFWNSRQMENQLRNALKIAHVLFPNCVRHWVFDNSSCHNCMPEGALVVTGMNVGPGGKQPIMNDTVIPISNKSGRGGLPQSFQFPLNLPDDHPHKKFEGQPKGMRVILEEHGYVLARPGTKKGGIPGDCQACKSHRARVKAKETNRDELDSASSEIEDGEAQDIRPVDCCMRRLLSMEEDFCAQKSSLELIIAESGGNDICHFLPKFHPEINPKEYYWGWCKRYFRERSNGNFAHAKKLLLEALNSCPLITIRRFFRRVERYMDVYSLGATGMAAEYAVKKYKSHRGVSQR